MLGAFASRVKDGWRRHRVVTERALWSKPGMLKALERIAKTLLAGFAAAALWRPGRRARAIQRLALARRVLLLRIDARVGEALLTTPLVRALAMARPD